MKGHQCHVAPSPGPKSQEHLARVGLPFLVFYLKFKEDKAASLLERERMVVRVDKFIF